MKTFISEVNRITPMKQPPEISSTWNMIQNFSQTIAPEEFQRPEAWSSKDRKSYFQSFLLNRLEGSFVFVDLLTALRKLDALDSDDPSREYFKELVKRCFRYITLDGNNRFTGITSFFNDEYTIPQGSYLIVMGDKVENLVVGPHNNTFSKLTEDIQHELKNRRVVINVYNEIDFQGLSDVFLNVNAGCPLNRQEKRNAFGTPYAFMIRELRKEFAPLLARLHGNDYKKRLKGDEWLVDAIIFSQMESDEVFGITQTRKDKEYYFDLPDLNKIRTNLEHIQDAINEVPEEQVRPNSVMNVFWLISNLDNVDRDLIIELFDENEKLYRDSKLVNEEGDTFRWACGGLGAKNNEFKLAELSNLLESVEV